MSQRTKEGASDYRYFPEPDLPPLQISRDWVDEIRSSLPELPHHRKARFVEKLELPAYDAALLTSDQAIADYFEDVLEAGPSPTTAPFTRAASNWMLGEMARLLNQAGERISEVKIEPRQLADLQAMVDDGTLSSTMAKSVFEKMYETGNDPKDIAEAEGLSPDFGYRRGARGSTAGDRGKSRAGTGISRRQAAGDGIHNRTGYEGYARQGQPTRRQPDRQRTS